MGLKYDIIFIGAGGFIAEHTLKELKNNFRVCATGRRVPDHSNVESFYTFRELKEKGVVANICIYNIGDSSRHNILLEPDKFQEQIKVNAPNFNTLFDDLSIKGVKHLITLGSSEEYGLSQNLLCEDSIVCPVTSYGISKTALLYSAREWAIGNKAINTHLRPFTVFGKNQKPKMFIPQLINELKNDRVFDMTGGEQFRHFTHVSTVVRSIHHICSTAQRESKIINIYDPFYFQLKQVANAIQEIIGLGKVNFGAIKYREAEIWEQKVPPSYFSFLSNKQTSFKEILEEVISYELQR